MINRFIVCSGVLLLAGCAAHGPIASHTSDEEVVAAITEDEERLWYLAHEQDKVIRRSNALYHDIELTEYLQSIMDRLYPEFDDTINVRIIRDMDLNAFAMANGSIYINMGMISRLDNEAQLAALLGHEGAHFTERHMLKGQRSLKKTAAFGTLFGAAVGMPELGTLITVSSITGFSRELEAEADAIAFERMHATGYDVGDAGNAFATFRDEIKALDIKRPFFFSTHPAMQDRARSFDQLARGIDSTGMVNRDIYMVNTQSVRIDVLEEMDANGSHDFLIYHLQTRNRLQDYPPFARFYLAEAIGERGEDDDPDIALYQYNVTMQEAPDFGPTYRELGMHYMKQGDNAQSVDMFQKYLALDPLAQDRGYIEKYVERLSQ